MLERAREFAASPQLGELVRAPMQDLDPPASHYDCVWLQYCVGYLMDVDLIALLQRLQKVREQKAFQDICTPGC